MILLDLIDTRLDSFFFFFFYYITYQTETVYDKKTKVKSTTSENDTIENLSMRVDVDVNRVIFNHEHTRDGRRFSIKDYARGNQLSAST